MQALSSFLIRTALIALTALLGACGGGNGLGVATSGDATTTPETSGPQAPTLSLTPTAIKTFRFTWTDVAGETGYRLLEDPDGTSGYTLVATLPADTTTHDHSVFLPERINARYLLQACQASSCADSAVVGVGGHLVEAMGYVKASDPADGDRFGASMALSANGQTLAVGASGNGTVGGNSGAVYVFTRHGSTWRQQALLEAPVPQAGDWFGLSLALSGSGDTLAVGAPNDSGTAPKGGATYLYTLQGAAWTLQARLTALVAGGGDLFGGSVALSADGQVLAVGAQGESGSGTGVNPPDDNIIAGSGAAYVFTRQATAWSQRAYIKASNTRASDHFGGRIALSGDGHTLAVGTPVEGPMGGFNGSAHVFTDGGGSWSQQAYLRASNSMGFARFGDALSLSADGQVLAVGSPFENSAATGIDGDQNNARASASGAVYVFARDNGTWSQRAYIKASNTGEDDVFGASLALSRDGKTLAVGAIGESSEARGVNGDQDGNAADRSGAAYVFRHTATGWRQQAYLKPSNTVADDVYLFGTALALSGDGQTLAVGCPYASNARAGVGADQSDTSGLDVGAVYLY